MLNNMTNTKEAIDNHINEQVGGIGKQVADFILENMVWKHINTAPKDGTVIEYQREYNGQVIFTGICHWRSCMFPGCFMGSQWHKEYLFTGWMHVDKDKQVPTPTHWKPYTASTNQFPYAQLNGKRIPLAKFQNNKTTEIYTVIGLVLNSTNAQNAQVMVQYKTLGGLHFVREFDEFAEKFTCIEST